MRAKQEDSSKHRGKPNAPSTGRGAASAMDALARQRVPAPAGGQAPQEQQHNEPKKKD
jgi:hypothetical protein